MGIREKILDMWSFFDYKSRYTEGSSEVISFPQWVPRDDARRLRAYALLDSYYRNYAREWLSKEATNDQKAARREYGDPNLIVQVTLSSLLGSTQRILTDGSVGGDDADKDAVAQQELLEDWARLEKFPMKIVENERQAIKLGDGVYVLGWDVKAKRPRLNVYDPGFYFPIFDPIAKGAEDFPNKVHIAYEYEVETEDSRPNSPKFETYVRRITWQLATMDRPRKLPWNDDPTDETCWFLDAIWRRQDIDNDVDRFDLSKANEVLSASIDGATEEGWVNLDIDFLPIVHTPNTVNLQSHFGDSVLGPVMQVLDDIVATDSDVQAASGTTGSPPIFIKGSTVGNAVQVYGPGTVLSGGDGVEVVDTSEGLKSLLSLKDALLERLSVNSRTPEALLGRVKPNEVPSGIALTLSFTPHTSMIQEMRIVRRDKYQLLLKFVARFYVQDGQLKKALPVELILGSFLPADKQEAMTMITQMLAAKAISLETAVQMAVDAGFNISDVIEEIQKIQSRDFESANQLVALTGDINEGLKYLGKDEIDPERADVLPKNEPDDDDPENPPTNEGE